MQPAIVPPVRAGIERAIFRVIIAVVVEATSLRRLRF